MSYHNLLSSIKRIAGGGTLAGIIAVCLTMLCSAAGVYQRSDLILGDLRDWCNDKPASGNTVLVGIDEQALAHFGGWPISRREIAVVLDKLNAAKARRIFVDCSFARGLNESDDLILEAALKRLGPSRVALPIVTLKGSRDSDGNYQEVDVKSHERFLESVSLASTDMPFDVDSRVRWIGKTSLGEVAKNPTMAAWLAKGNDARPGLSSIDYGINLDSIPMISFADIAKSSSPHPEIAGKNVVIGLVAERVMQPVLVPLHGKLQRGHFMALATETIALSSNSVAVPFWTVWLWTITAAPIPGPLPTKIRQAGRRDADVIFDLSILLLQHSPSTSKWSGPVAVFPYGLSISDVPRHTNRRPSRVPIASASWPQSARQSRLRAGSTVPLWRRRDYHILTRRKDINS
jgi:hypothetical protein